MSDQPSAGSGESERQCDVTFWRKVDCDGIAGIDLAELERAGRPSTLSAASFTENNEVAASKGACQLGLLGAVLPSTLNSTITLCMSNLNFQLVLARQHTETLQSCATNWQSMQYSIGILSKELSELAAESSLHNFHLPPAVTSKGFTPKKSVTS